MIKPFFILLSFFIVQYSFGQCKLTIIQEGPKSELMGELLVMNYKEIKPERINDSTIEYTYYPTEPVYLFILVDSIRHNHISLMYNWRTHIWIAPEVKHRELIINYATKEVQIIDFVKWKKNADNLHEWDSVEQFIDKLYHEGRDSEKQNVAIPYIEKYPDSYLSLNLIGYINNNNKKLEYFNKLNPALNKYSQYHQLKADLSGGRKYPNAGDTFKEFTLIDINGKVFNSANIKNKWILLHFWSNGCGPCVKEMDDMVKYYNTLDTSKIAFISVTLDEDRNKWEKAPTTQKIKWTSLWEPDGGYGDLCLNYNVYSMPFFILFNNEKKLVVLQDGADALESTIKGYLSKVK